LLPFALGPFYSLKSFLFFELAFLLFVCTLLA